MKWLASLELIAALALADNCRVRVRTDVVLPLVEVPAYSAQYVGGGDTDKRLDELERKLDAILRAIQGGKAAPVLQDAPHAGVFRTDCAQCHGANVAAGQGNGLVLVNVDGSMARLTEAQRLRVIEMVDEGVMPKGGQALSDEKFQAVMKGMVGRKYHK